LDKVYPFLLHQFITFNAKKQPPMKTFFAVITLLSAIALNAQDEASNNETFVRNMDKALNTFNTNNVNGSSFYFKNPKRDIKGSIHLFENWENIGVLKTTKGQSFRVKNINVNLKNQTFESKFHRDSIFTFSFSELDRFVINNRSYKNYYYDEDNRIYEIIYESDAFSVLKGFRLELVEGSANPMLNRKDDKYLQKDNYYLFADDAINTFKLKKKRILRLITDNQSKQEKIQKYVKDNKLSYKDEYHLTKIFDYGIEN